jgi:hypothetical protein
VASTNEIVLRELLAARADNVASAQAAIRMHFADDCVARCRMTTRLARCAWRDVEITVDGEPSLISRCHCDFCQKRSESV